MKIRARSRLAALTAVMAIALPLTAIGSTGAVAADKPIAPVALNLEGADGVHLDSALYLPAKLPAPAILLAHGFGGSKDSVATEAQYLAKNGYAVLAWSARGFGQSTGQITMDSPQHEIADVQALITYLSTRKEVTQQKSGDPLIGIAGASYGGAAALLTAGIDHRIDAVVSDITWNNLQNSLFPQSVQGSTTPGPFKKVWAGSFFAIATLPNAYLGECGNFAPQWCAAFVNSLNAGAPTAEAKKLLLASSPSTIADKITAPTLLMQGESDSLFQLSESVATASQISKAHPKTPLSMVWHASGHDGGADESAYLNGKTLAWFDKYLRGKSVTFPKFEVVNSNGTISLQDSTVVPKNLQSTVLPLAQKGELVQLSPQLAPFTAPIGGIPAALSTLPGLGSALSLASSAIASLGASAIPGGVASPALLPGQSAVFDSAPLTKPLTIIGGSTVKVHVSSNRKDATLFFSLVVHGANGGVKQPNGLVAPVYIPDIPASGADVNINLPAVVVDASIGDSISLAVSSTDQGFQLPNDGRFYSVQVISPLRIPLTPLQAAVAKSDYLKWPIAAVVTIAFAFGLVAWRRPRFNKVAAEESDALVSVSHLSKIYKDGYQAVSDLSFSVKRGQVVGLLGPNGAGKTTTLRMVMGLIYPTEGEIAINNEPIYPGSPALANLGSFVEGPGFLPHLSGRENLSLYWKSIGRDDDPKLEEALEIAGLGTALDKKVRSYSQGMRQRLAIAQAMLGMPDLLVLDEPTNGLDPQQIVAMRKVLKKYAKTGRTVIISSHLLSEIQQTCTHVVLMHRGRLIAFGTMRKILTRAGKKVENLEDIFIELIGDDLTIGKE
mgnify:CR=1 FL=1